MATDANMTGYNPEQVTELATTIKTSAETISQAIVEKLTNGVIQPISEQWFAQEAVEFFEAFQDVVKETGTAIKEAYDSFITSVESAGNNWAKEVKGTTVTLERIDDIDLTLDISAITTEDSNGNIGIHEDGATNVANGLGAVREEIEAAINEETQKLDAETAFLGRDQAQAVTNCFGTVNQAVSKIFNFLIEGDNNLQSQINAAVQKYGDIGTGTANAFNNATVE